MTARERKLMMGGEVDFWLQVGVQWLSPVAAEYSYRCRILDNSHWMIGDEAWSPWLWTVLGAV